MAMARGTPSALRLAALSLAVVGLCVAAVGLPLAAVALSERFAIRSATRLARTTPKEDPDREFLGTAVASALSRAPARPSSSADQPPAVFVDTTIAGDSCDNYEPASRRCSGGHARAVRSLAAAARAAMPGDIVVLRGGTYAEALVPSASGTPDAPIVFRAQEGEKAVLTGALDPAIDLSQRTHIILERLIVNQVVGWLRAENAAFCVIRNCIFAEASAGDKRGGLAFSHATDNQVRDNVISGGYDAILLADSSRNVVQGNTIVKARHASWAILCGKQNIIRRNILANAGEEVGRVVDCEGVSDDAHSQNAASVGNLIEENLFHTPDSLEHEPPSPGLEYGARDGIVRNNAFAATGGSGLRMALDSGRARLNTDNRIYHNVFFAERLAGIELPADEGAGFSGNVFKNNILYGSRVAVSDDRWPETAAELRGKPVQLLTGRLSGFVMERNVLYGTMPSQPFVITVVGREKGKAFPPQTLAQWQKSQPQIFRENINVRPVFRDERRLLLNLADESVLIDAGAFLARAAADGSGTALSVDDARWFFDGFGIAGEKGDAIQLEGDTTTARVVRVDHETRVLTLDHPLKWHRQQGVSLRYVGRAPSLGLSDAMDIERQKSF
jgi:parallel beta-helix repeat protein